MQEDAMKSHWIRILIAALLVAAVGVSAPVMSAEKKPAPKPKAGATCPKPAPKDSSKAKTKQTPAKKTDPKKKADPEKTEKPLPKLLDLGSDKCIPCKMMTPVLDELKKDYKGKLNVEFIDVWKDKSAGEKYKVSTIPTQIFYDAKGKELFRHIGYYPKADILAKFKELGIKLTK
jgi:thioredoxin 1